MAQSPPSSLSHSPTLSSLHSNLDHSNFHKKTILNVITSPFTTQLSIKTVVHKVLFHFIHARLFCVHLRVLILLILPSLYLFISNHHRLFIMNLLFIIAFSITLLVCVSLVLPRMPSIRLLVARSLPNKKFKSTPLPTKASKPVVWSIGSKPKKENRPFSGSWVQVYSNGDVYEGEFHEGKCSGSGVYYYYMSGRYEGDWVDEKYDGYGVETWAKGSRYRGQYRQGLRHGIGVYRFYTGDVYAGDWCNGQCHGCGVHTCEDGSKYVGEFKWGVKHGLGHYHFRNGDVYAGEYFADKMHGFGVYQFGNGHRYDGAWHEGRRQGLGMYTFRNGETQSGHWQNGILDVSTAENGNPGALKATSHSKVLSAVQQARRSAEKAYDVARIEERVNKTGASANKAANAARVAAVKAVQRQMHHQNSDDVPPLFV
ncbi:PHOSPHATIDYLINOSITOL-4-PHOSPHATE 5-KINASE RELATED [Salix purpurea]|uniref:PHOSPHATIDYLINOSITOL-4-PHOSPHATE 5-KINASE RELATED n=1 Tax=Salix purpurea TaxID=77065 RepID=A0A9Q0QGU2_SALPP|nr:PHOSPHATIDYLINOSITOL-4-PHOSPHATE 5-KINASE RELATED [Salix purpurea]